MQRGPQKDCRTEIDRGDLQHQPASSVYITDIAGSKKATVITARVMWLSDGANLNQVPISQVRAALGRGGMSETGDMATGSCG